MSTTALWPISLFLVDDHPIVRRGLRHLLTREDDLEVADEAGSGEEALNKISSDQPDLVIVDISMEGMDGLELTRRLDEQWPDISVLIVSMHNEIHYVESALEAGASGYIIKDKVNEVIVEAVREVMEGEQYICGELKKSLNGVGEGGTS